MGDTQTQTAAKRQTLTRGQPAENLRKWRREVFNELVWDSKLPEQIKLKGGFDDVVRKAAGMTVPGNFMAFTPDELKTKALAAKIEDAKLGDPPWDSATEARALGLRATLDFESLPNASGAAEVVGGNHANPAFWVNQARAGGGGSGRDKTFIFKPPTPKSDVDGFPEGGDIAREALAARLGDVLRGLTGLDLAIPQTNMVDLSRSNFPANLLPQPAPGDQSGMVRGSLQQFTAARGDLQSIDESDRARMPQKACEKIVVLDMLSLNIDRHSGNMMVGSNAAGEETLVPIDHGMTFPTRDGMAMIVDRLGGRHSAVLRLPNAHKPFSPETLAALQQLDPNAYAAVLKQERDTLKMIDPKAGSTLEDSTIEMSRRSAKFLRLVATEAKTLTAAAAQVALATNSPQLFDPDLDDADFDVAARAIIALAMKQQQGLPQIMAASKADYADMTTHLTKAGLTGFSGIEVKGSIQFTYPVEMMMAFRAGLTPDQKVISAKNDRSCLYENIDGTLMKGDEDKHAAAMQDAQTRFEDAGGFDALEPALVALGMAGKAAAAARADCRIGLEKITLAAALADVRTKAAGLNLDVMDVRRELARMEVVAAFLPQGDPLMNAVNALRQRSNTGLESMKQEIIDLVEEINESLLRHFTAILPDLTTERTELAVKYGTSKAVKDLDDHLKYFATGLQNRNGSNVAALYKAICERTAAMRAS